MSKGSESPVPLTHAFVEHTSGHSEREGKDNTLQLRDHQIPLLVRDGIVLEADQTESHWADEEHESIKGLSAGFTIFNDDATHGAPLMSDRRAANHRYPASKSRQPHHYQS